MPCGNGFFREFIKVNIMFPLKERDSSWLRNLIVYGYVQMVWEVGCQWLKQMDKPIEPNVDLKSTSSWRNFDKNGRCCINQNSDLQLLRREKRAPRNDDEIM